MRSFARSSLVLAVVALAACAAQAPAPTPPPDTRAEDEATIRAAVQEWSASAQAKDPEKFASFYADDAVLMLEGMPDVHGSAGIQEAIGGMMQDPHFALSFEADSVTVARSSDLAVETGSYSMTISDAKKKPATQVGHYVVVWKKEADGGWKVWRDVPVSDPPAAAN
jgi:uncharacterized protein (TIGR02246 family)